MAYRNVPSPGSIDARYEELSGGQGERVLLYIARRHLGMSWKEWQDTPWWVRRAYIEGLEQEELLEFGPSDELGWEIDPRGADVSDFAASGFTVIQGG
jgi:hypothetical protein